VTLRRSTLIRLVEMIVLSIFKNLPYGPSGRSYFV
jgi:hypothetical protein